MKSYHFVELCGTNFFSELENYFFKNYVNISDKISVEEDFIFLEDSLQRFKIDNEKIKLDAEPFIIVEFCITIEYNNYSDDCTHQIMITFDDFINYVLKAGIKFARSTTELILVESSRVNEIIEEIKKVIDEHMKPIMMNLLVENE